MRLRASISTCAIRPLFATGGIAPARSSLRTSLTVQGAAVARLISSTPKLPQGSPQAGGDAPDPVDIGGELGVTKAAR